MRSLMESLDGKREREIGASEARCKRVLFGAVILEALIAIYMLVFSTIIAGPGAYILLSLSAVLLWALVLSVYAYIALQRVLRYRKQKLVESSFTDELTGLLNWNALRASLQDTYVSDEGPGKWTRVMYVGVRNLDDINAKVGYAKGDAILRDVAGIIEDHVRRGDSAGRVTGSQFLVVMPSAIAAEVDVIAARLQRRLMEYTVPAEMGQEGGTLEPEVGVASYPLDGQHLDELVASAKKQTLKTPAEEH